MKSSKKDIRDYISKLIREYLSEAEEEENPFAAAGDEGGEEKPADEKGGTEDDKDSEAKKDTQPAGVPIKFDISKVKKYNDANFLSDKGIVKSIDKRGVIVTTQPDGVDILVTFDDITESAKKFFKSKK